jgi:hypothetical protein
LSYDAPNWMKQGYNDCLNTRNKFSKLFSPNHKISLSILNELKEPRF